MEEETPLDGLDRLVGLPLLLDSYDESLSVAVQCGSVKSGREVIEEEGGGGGGEREGKVGLWVWERVRRECVKGEEGEGVKDEEGEGMKWERV